MAAETSALPMDISGLLNEETASGHLLQDDPFLQQLLNSQGVDFLTSMCDSTSSDHTVEVMYQGTAGNQPMLQPSLNFESLLTTPLSPVGSEGYTSETSSTTNCNRLDSPVSSLVSAGGGSGSEHQGAWGSPAHSPPMTERTVFSDPSQWSPTSNGLEAGQRNSGSDYSGWSESPRNHQVPINPPSDIRIDVESLRYPTGATPPPSHSERKAATLVLSDEEKRLLSEEGISLPTDMPLTKAEQKHLKSVQRKIKNKVSAHESRKRKKEYVDGLEQRVKLSTHRNQELTKKVDKLQTENSTLSQQLQNLQELVAGLFPSKLQAGTAGTMLMVLTLSFSLFLFPSSDNDKLGYQVSSGYARQTRSLLFTETDHFGNVVDPKTGTILSVAGGHTPFPLPPWLHQTPAILQWMNRTRLTDTARRLFSGVATDDGEADGIVSQVHSPQET